MNLLKPAHTEVTYRTVSLAPGRHSLSIALLAHFSLHPDGEPAANATSPVWDAINPAMKNYAGFDEGWPKMNGEYLVFGAAYSPSNSQRQPVSVRVTVGELEKRLAVFGDRYFNGFGGISDPMTFDRMPIAPQTAFGGESFDANPYGKGYAEIKGEDGSLVQPLPNVEMPEALMVSSTDKPGVAGFWPYYPDMSQRARYLGKFDEEWIKTRWPHLPAETDFTYFQVAPPDQRLSGRFWKGGERIELQNMHPVHQTLQAFVPELRPRLFAVAAVTDKDIRFAELDARLETICLLPDQLSGIALYRAVVQVRDPQARDIVGLCAALEPLSESARAPEQYVAVFEPAMREQLGPVVRKPAPIAPKDQDHQAQLAQAMAQLQQQRQIYAKHLQETGMSETEMMSLLRRNPQTRALAKVVQESGGSLGGFLSQFEGMINELLGETDQRGNRDLAQPEGSAGRIGRLHVMRCKANSEPCRDLNLAEADLSGLDLSGMDFGGAVLAGANLTGCTLLRASFDRGVLVGANFAGADLSAASFAMCSMSEAKLQAAMLANANFARADVSGAAFTDAVLDGVDLTMANLTGADFRNANLSGVSATRANFTAAQLQQANLAGAKLIEVNFSGADLTGADFSKANALKASFSCAKLYKARFTSADLTESVADEGTQAMSVDFRDAHFDKASWVAANLSGSNLDRITGQETDFSDASMVEVTMRRAVAKGARFDRAVIERADFSMSNFMEGSFGLSSLKDLNMQQSNLYGVNFLDTEFQNVNLDGSYIERTILAHRLGKSEA